MSLAIKYENANDAQLRLKNTIVLYKDAPVKIVEVQAGAGKADDTLRVYILELPLDEKKVFDKFDEGGKRKYISSKHFDIAPFKMGYVNRPTDSGAFYTSRLPNRIQKQGLCVENFKAMDNFNKAVEFSTFLRCKETPAMIGGHYPTFKQALASLDKVRAVAFSREFCLVKDEIIPQLVYIYHKGSKVGMYSDNKVSLGNKFLCLKEQLQELGLKAGAF